VRQQGVSNNNTLNDSSSNNIIFPIENLPYLYQSHFHNIGFATNGYYLDTKGNKYEYSIPEFDLIKVADDRLNQDKSNSLNEASVTVLPTGYTIKPIDPIR